jgi:Cu(I)/Ag(I) efflux system protein CusF
MKPYSSLFLLAGLVTTTAWAADMGSNGYGGTVHSAMSNVNHGAKASDLSRGVVRKINKAQGKLTIQHGPLDNLNMPAMTMIFRVTNPAWLDQVKPGDSIRFRAEMMNGQLTVTHIEVVR